MKIVVAVSGGVDSVVLLHKLVHGADKNKLAVAHFDHAMRPDSWHDAAFVEALAEKYALDFYGSKAKVALSSENDARQARWAFLNTVKKRTHADKIATGHHQDDVLETMIINVLRGTGRSGLSSLGETNKIIRPLLAMTKSEIYAYALDHALEWVEDETNRSDKYVRNQVRRYVLPKFNYYERDQLLRINAKAAINNRYLNTMLEQFTANYLQHGKHKTTGQRSEFMKWPYELRKELVKHVWQRLHYEEVDGRDIERLVVAIATAQPGVTIDGSKQIKLDVSRTEFTLYLSQ